MTRAAVTSALQALSTWPVSEALSGVSPGWGVPTVPAEIAGTPRSQGGRGGRGSRGRRGRGKGGRRGLRGYRRGRGYGYDDEDDSESDGGGYVEPEVAAPVSGVSKIVVEQIYGWRWPLSQKNRKMERCGAVPMKCDAGKAGAVMFPCKRAKNCVGLQGRGAAGKDAASGRPRAILRAGHCRAEP